MSLLKLGRKTDTLQHLWWVDTALDNGLRSGWLVDLHRFVRFSDLLHSETDHTATDLNGLSLVRLQLNWLVIQY